jgi:elongation factor G
LVASVVAASVDADGHPYHVLRVWAGELKPGVALVNGATGAASRVRKFFQVRGPRRAAAKSLGPGSVVAVWEPLQARPGDTLTSRARLELRRVHMRPPMASLLLEPSRPHDEPKLERALEVLTRLDHGINLSTCEVTGHWVIAGRSSLQLERDAGWIASRLGVSVQPSVPPVAYRERPVVAVRGAEGLHVRERDGLNEEFARVVLDVVPLMGDAAITVVDARDDEQFPEQFLAAVEAGLRDALAHGPLAGFPVHGVAVTIVGGQYDMFASEEAHFRLAAQHALETALAQARTHVVEPWCSLVVRVPGSCVGSVMTELGSQRAIIQGMEIDDHEARVAASCPVRLTRGFDARLDAMTGGRGWFTTHPTEYQVLPEALLPRVVAMSPMRGEAQGTGNRPPLSSPLPTPLRVVGKVGK